MIVQIIGTAMVAIGVLGVFMSACLLFLWVVVEGRTGLRRWFLGLPHDRFADPKFRPRVAGLAILIGCLIPAFTYV